MAELFFYYYYYFINAIISTLHVISLYCCLHWYLAHSYILLYFDVFSPLLISTLLATKNESPPTVFDLGGWNGHHFVGNWVAETVTYHFLNIWSLFLKKKYLICFSNMYYSEIWKNSTRSCAPSHGKWNKIIKFVLSLKLWEEIGFLQDPQKAYIFYAIHFLYVCQKKSWNKLCLEPHDTYIFFRTFFSHENIKRFFLSSNPFKGTVRQ